LSSAAYLNIQTDSDNPTASSMSIQGSKFLNFLKQAKQIALNGKASSGNLHLIFGNEAAGKECFIFYTLSPTFLFHQFPILLLK